MLPVFLDIYINAMQERSIQLDSYGIMEEKSLQPTYISC